MKKKLGSKNILKKLEEDCFYLKKREIERKKLALSPPRSLFPYSLLNFNK